MNQRNPDFQLSLDFNQEKMMNHEAPHDMIESIADTFQEVYHIYQRRSKKSYGIEQIDVSFFSYTSLKHTIRIKDRVATIKISHFARFQQTDFYQCLAHRLWSDLFRMKCPSDIKNKFNESESRLHKDLVKKGLYPATAKQYEPVGLHHDLTKIFSDVNRTYFNRGASGLQIGWSRKKALRRLGHYDARAKTIMISKTLDHPDVPHYVIEFIVFHEALHHVISFESAPEGKRYHGRFFKQNEKKYHQYAEAARWLKSEYPKLVRSVRRK
jgi:hypothetical protein